MRDLKLNNENYNTILEWSFGIVIDAIWLSVCDLYESYSFEDRKNLFLDFLYRVLSEGKARLFFDDVSFEVEVSEQIKLFENNWPAEEDMNDFFFWLDKDDRPWAPGWLVWIGENNQEIWS